MKTKDALITGATGFVGFHLAEKLLERGWRVSVIARESSDITNIVKLATTRIHRHDGTTSHMCQILEASRPDIIFHLASSVTVEHRPENVEELIQSNITFGTQLLEGMRQTGCTAIINTGSYWQHYQGADYCPVNLYAATKQAFEDILCFYAEAYRMRALTLKLFDVYGPGDPRKKIFYLFEQSLQTGQTLDMSPGEQLLDLVHLDDVTDAYCQAAKLIAKTKPPFHPSYAISSGRMISLREVAAAYEKIAGQKLNIHWGGRPYRDREVMSPWRGTGLPGWRASIDLAMGIRTLMAHAHPQKTVAQGTSVAGSVG